MKKIFLCSLIFLCGCATTFKPVEIKPLELTQTAEYSVDLSKLDTQLKEASNFNVMYGIMDSDGNINITEDDTNATHVILAPEDYSKTVDITDLSIAYRDVVKGQEALMNVHIDTINSLKELLRLERTRAQILNDAWMNSEQMFNEEKKARSRDNLFHEFRFWGTVIGSTVLFVATL